MTAPKHILILTPGFPENEADDTCMPYLQTYLREASKEEHGLRFTVISLQYPYKSKSYKWHGISVYACGGSNRSFPWRFHYWRKAWRKLSQTHSEKPIDSVHSLWLSECTLLAQKWTARNGVKHIATAMGQDVLISNRYLKQISLGLPSLVAVSDFQNNSLQKSTGKRANQIIPWGMGSAEHENDTRDIDILGVGSLIPLKAFDSFLRVIAEVVKSRPKLRVVLIGDGPDRRSLEKLANELGIDRNVQFAGKKSREEVLAMMRKSKVLLHTSTFESQGFVFNEAYACGMSIVSTQVGLAKAAERWLVCQTEEEMVDGVVSLLVQIFESEALVSVQNTVEEYKKIYVQS